MSFVLNAFRRKTSEPVDTSTTTTTTKDINKLVEPSYAHYYSRLDKQSKLSCGLVEKNSSYAATQFELTDFDIKVEMGDASSQTVFTQRYKNGYTSPVEAKYQIPLAPYAAVSNFVVEYDGKTMRGEVKGKQEAFNNYSDGIASGHQAFLGEKTDNGYFTLSIGNLPPGKEVTISITIISEVGLHLSDLHYCLHRYMFPDNSINLNVDMSISLSSPIESIEVDHYKQTAKIDGAKATLQLSHQGIVTKNLIIIVKPAINEKPAYFVESNTADKTAAVALNFYPQFQIAADEVDQKSEYIFLLDCSGSMSGTPITKAKRALEILMRSLTEKSKFNIYLFGSNFTSMFPAGSELYNDATLQSASNYIQKIDADLGGTELLPPMKAILSAPYDPQYPRQVFILTDGEISERDKLIDYVGKEANTTRIFTLGIGGGVDKELVVGLSRACKGYYEFIQDNSDMETQVMKLMSIALEPTISNIRVDWGDLSCEQAPAIVRPIFNNERMIIYGMVKDAPSEGTKNVRITCDGPAGSELVYELSLDFSLASTNTTALHTLTAYELIKDMEELERKKKGDFKEKITVLGVKYRLVSKHTSFVVVSESDQPTTEPVQQVNVIKEEVESRRRLSNVSSVSGGGGGRGGSVMASPSRSRRLSVDAQDQLQCIKESIQSNQCLEQDVLQQLKDQSECLSSSSHYSLQKKSGGAGFFSKLFSKPSSPSQTYSSASYSSPPPPPPVQSSSSYSSPPPPPGGDILLDLIRSQKANGSWVVGGVTITIPDTPSELQSEPDVWVTLIVIAKITKQFADKKSQWDLVVGKAQTWVIRTLKLQQSKERYQELLDIALKAI